jgi:hypothetical protein
MAFLTYKKIINNGQVHYTRLQPLRLSGVNGLIARHVKTLPQEQTKSWQITTAELLKLAGESEPTTTVLFDVTVRKSTSVCLYELTRIHGSCEETSTQLALDFVVVADREMGPDAPNYATDFEIPIPEKPHLLGEILALSGGTAGGNWKWDESPMQLGATVVQPGGCTSCHGGSCASCG